MNERRAVSKTFAELGIVRNPGWADDFQLSHMKREFDAGNPFAPINALAACAVARRALPDWATEGIFSLLRDAIEARVWTYGKGPNQTPMGKAIGRFVDLERYDVVRSVVYAQGRKRRPKLLDGYSSTFTPEQSRTNLLARYKKRDVAFGKNLEDAQHAASALLKGHFGKGSYDQVRLSYNRVSRWNARDASDHNLHGVAAELLGVRIA